MIFIVHNQLRKYKRYGHFYGIDLFLVFAKDYSHFRGMYDKNQKNNADYDSVTLIKNAPGLAIISGRQMNIGNCTIDFFFGAGIRLLNNKLQYVKQTIHAGECTIPHFAWHNDKYSGTFPAGHFSCGIKLGYILNRKRQ